jgi:hypothetical protein
MFSLFGTKLSSKDARAGRATFLPRKGHNNKRTERKGLPVCIRMVVHQTDVGR